MKNDYTAKFIRTITSIFPVDKTRKGGCINCGECCKLPNKCIFLGDKDGKSYCRIYYFRGLNCRKYPRTNNEHLTKESCGYKFEQ